MWFVKSKQPPYIKFQAHIIKQHRYDNAGAPNKHKQQWHRRDLKYADQDYPHYAHDDDLHTIDKQGMVPDNPQKRQYPVLL
jgi:hypothetical protein